MNSSMVFLAVFIPIFLMVHLLVYNIQLVSGKNYFYGVYVKNITLNEEDKKRIDKGYKRKMNLVFLLMVILFIINAFLIKYNSEIVSVVLMLAYTVVSFVYLKKYYEEVKYLKSNVLSSLENSNLKNENKRNRVAIDTELLNAKMKLKKKFTILFGISIALSVISALYLAINYNNLPDTIITHWGANGNADGFSEKSFQSVFFISFMDLSLVVLMAFMTVETIGARMYIDTTNLEENRKKAINYLNKLGYCFFLLTLSIQSITTTMPIFMVNQMDVPMILFIPSMILPIFLSIVLMYYFIRLSSLKTKNKDINPLDSDDEKWLYGFIYYNKEDPSFVVEKRFGAGWTFNLASTKGKLITVLLVVMIVSSLVIPFFM
ncbi:MAG: DUF1648 domain-containing protein [Peptostreptococcaceae bacterium]